MKAWVLEAPNTIPRLRSDLEPPRPGPGEVLVKVEAAGVCYRDFLNYRGLMPRTVYPTVMGHEFAGTVAEVGEGVEDLVSGDRVTGLPYRTCGACAYCLSGRENLCRNRRQLGEEVAGTWAEYTVASRRDLVKVPRAVSPADASICGCVLGMLLHALRDVAQAKTGERVLVTGAGGGVGVHAVVLAKYLGCRVIASTRSGWKAERLRELGADHVVVAEGSRIVDEVKSITGGEGVGLAVECVGAPTLQHSLRSVSWGGRIVLVGNITVSNAEIPLGYMILRENAIMGAVGSKKRSLRDALALIEAGLIKPVVERHRLEEAENLLQLLERGETFGKHVLMTTR
jgi:acryloyl-coenzyme A reductase